VISRLTVASAIIFFKVGDHVLVVALPTWTPSLKTGTATLEAALLNTPMVVVYKESWLNWNILGRLINVDHYGLVNLVAGERVAAELMQDELNGERLAEELLSLLQKQRNYDVRKRLREVANQLGEDGASTRAAETILEFLG